MAGNNNELEKRLWTAADQLRANSNLTSAEYSGPVLGLIFLKFADQKFTQAETLLKQELSGAEVTRADYQARGVLYVPEKARYSYILNLAESENIGKAVNEAMKAIETENEDLRDVLPKTYNAFDNDLLVALLKNFASIPMDTDADAFGKIYEYFLGKFALAEGRGGGEFFTPTSLVRLIVEVIEPFHGRIYDPACGSGGMFVQSARFVENHKRNPSHEISIYGQEKTAATIRLSKMNLAVHGLSGDIRQGNTYYEDLHDSVSRFDFVMANPPFNVNGIDKEKLREDKRFPYGLPTADKGNYIWIQVFASTLNVPGRAGFVMANSATDARQSELEIRKRMIEDCLVDVMISVGSNMFYTVTLPCTLWFLDRGKRNTDRKDKVLFIDARKIYQQIDRAHREFLPEQIEFIANIVRLYRGEYIEIVHGSEKLMKESFPKGKYQDVAGLCKIATLKEIEEHGWSLNSGRYVGVAEEEQNEFDFKERFEELNEELEVLNVEARELEEQISANVRKILEVK